MLRYEIVRRRLAKLGYAVSGAVYNTADFGLPQQRNRAWLLCVLESELATSESQLEKDMNLFRRHCTPMSKCVDLSATFVKEPQERKPGKPGKPDAKWRDALDQQFDIYGKAGITKESKQRVEIDIIYYYSLTTPKGCRLVDSSE